MAQGVERFDSEPWDLRDVFPVVALICSIGVLLLFATATPSPGYTKSRGGSTPEKACVANLKQLQIAKAAYAEQHHLPAGTALPVGCLWSQNGSLKLQPECPSGSEYYLGAVGELPKCGVGGEHSLK